MLPAAELLEDLGPQHLLAQERPQPFQQRLGRGRHRLAVPQQAAGIAPDEPPRVEQPFPKRRALIGERDLVVAVLDAVRVDQAQRRRLLLRVGLDAQFKVHRAAPLKWGTIGLSPTPHPAATARPCGLSLLAENAGAYLPPSVRRASEPPRSERRRYLACLVNASMTRSVMAWIRASWSRRWGRLRDSGRRAARLKAFARRRRPSSCCGRCRWRRCRSSCTPACSADRRSPTPSSASAVPAPSLRVK